MPNPEGKWKEKRKTSQARKHAYNVFGGSSGTCLKPEVELDSSACFWPQACPRSDKVICPIWGCHRKVPRETKRDLLHPRSKPPFYEQRYVHLPGKPYHNL